MTAQIAYLLDSNYQPFARAPAGMVAHDAGQSGCVMMAGSVVGDTAYGCGMASYTAARPTQVSASSLPVAHRFKIPGRVVYLMPEALVVDNMSTPYEPTLAVSTRTINDGRSVRLVLPTPWAARDQCWSVQKRDERIVAFTALNGGEPRIWLDHCQPGEADKIVYERAERKLAQGYVLMDSPAESEAVDCGLLVARKMAAGSGALGAWF